MKLLIISFLSVAGAFAATPTCSVVNFPAVVVNGQIFQPAIVNGVDSVGDSVVRFQFYSDATANPVNQTRIVYATLAQWTANPGVYPQTWITGTSEDITGNSTLQGNLVSGLTPATTYHMAGQSSADNGATWCPASQTDTTFTTLPLTNLAALPQPVKPATMTLSEPTITGTDRTLGVSTGCSTLAACLSISNPGSMQLTSTRHITRRKRARIVAQTALCL